VQPLRAGHIGNIVFQHRFNARVAASHPPMSTLLENQGIDLIQGYDPSQLEPRPDLVIIGVTS
jgi:UDP-N-acetylmuramate: L-alanyl-gamma-D-glutamyl-meso-diaminopimelate ligase